MNRMCGVFGVFAPGRPVSHLVYLGLYALQHRGQESAGMAVADAGTLTVVRDMGLVSNVFDDRTLAALSGTCAVGHTRYSTTGSSTWRNAQPVYRDVDHQQFALAHNGNLTNVEALADAAGMLPGIATSDSDLVAELLAQHLATGGDLVDALAAVLPTLAGAYSLALIDDARIIGARDPDGFRPLCLGRLDGGWVLASETPALDIVGAAFVRELEPGEIVVIDADGPRSIHPFADDDVRPHLCLFEFVYFARPDAQLYGASVAEARTRMGERLAVEAPLAADGHRPERPAMVMPVPESGVPAAQGFARASGIPYGDGLVKNRYIGRTFIAPSQELRDPQRAAQAEPAPQRHRRQATGGRRRLHRPRHHHPRRGRHAPGSRRRRGAPADHVAALPVAVLLRDGHRRPRRAAGGAPGRRGDPRLRRGRLVGVPLPRRPAGRHRRAGRRLLHRLPHRRLPGPRPADAHQVGPGRGAMSSYKASGVDLDAADETVARLARHVRSTYRPEVLGDIGGFGGLVSLPSGYADPVLVSSTDGVGTKLKVAEAAGRFDTIGIDLVAMCVDDVAVQGADPLFFLDYVGVGRLEPAVVERIVAGVADGCRQAGCALVGGEVAEHGRGHSMDLAGFCVGVVSRAELLTGAAVAPGDAVVGLLSPGLRSNGYSLARQVLAGAPELVDELLRPSVIYSPRMAALRRSLPVHAFAHVTGGGLPGNVARILPARCDAVIHRGTWPEPPIFGEIRRRGDVAEGEMERVFNLGVGMVAVVPAAVAPEAVALLGEAVVIGEIVPGSGGVRLV